MPQYHSAAEYLSVISQMYVSSNEIIRNLREESPVSCGLGFAVRMAGIVVS